ncbi:uncharacterized protein LOC100715271 [Cavia porcellus]|uniref:uncharacterized protein LOC100715271 n=1 Tax=Cavia porcellus TaxID=10141 RepID=UPI002FE28CFB
MSTMMTTYTRRLIGPVASVDLTERHSMLLIWKHDLELSELSDNLIQGRGLSLLIKKNLEVLLSRGYPDTTEGQGYRQHLLEGYRLVEQLIHSLDPEMWKIQECSQRNSREECTTRISQHPRVLWSWSGTQWSTDEKDTHIVGGTGAVTLVCCLDPQTPAKASGLLHTHSPLLPAAELLAQLSPVPCSTSSAKRSLQASLGGKRGRELTAISSSCVAGSRKGFFKVAVHEAQRSSAAGSCFWPPSLARAVEDTRQVPGRPLAQK